MAMLNGLPAWLERPGSIRDDITQIRTARLRRQASVDEEARDAARVEEARARPLSAMQESLPTVFSPDAGHPKLREVLSALRGAGYDIVTFDVGGAWQKAYQDARAAYPGRRVIMMGFATNVDGAALGYLCTGTEDGDVAAMTCFEPLAGMTLLGRMRCRTRTRLVRLEGDWVDIRATCTLERWRFLPPHMRRHWLPRDGQVTSRRGEGASAFLERVTVAELERQVRMMERAGKVSIPA